MSDETKTNVAAVILLLAFLAAAGAAGFGIGRCSVYVSKGTMDACTYYCGKLGKTDSIKVNRDGSECICNTTQVRYMDGEADE